MKLHKKQGFSILGILLFIATIVVALGIWTFSGSINTNDNDKNLDVIAMSVVNEGLKYKAAFEMMNIGQSNVFYRSMQFSPNVTNTLNLLDPSRGLGWEPINKKALIPNADFPKGYWAFNKRQFFAPQVGAAFPDPSFIVAGISDTICKRINFLLHGKSIIPVFTDYTYEINEVITKTDAVSSDYIYMHSFTGARKWTSGCINHGNNPNDNFYYQVAFMT